MTRKLLGKISLYLITIFLVGSLNFALIHLMPGDAMVHLLGEEGYAYLSRDIENLNALKADFGMDGSLVKRYERYVIKMLTGEWGWSFYYGRPVTDIVAQRLQWTLLLLLPAVLLSTLLGGSIGAISGWKSRSSRAERLLPLFFLFLYATPGYCIGLLLLAAAAHTESFPIGGMMGADATLWRTICHMALPLTVLTINGTAYKFMIMRNAVRQELNMPYVLTALAKGLTEHQVLFCHILKNTFPPYISVVALNLGFMVGGSLLVEVVFSWQGMGTLIYQAVLSRDFPLLSGSLMVICLSVLAANVAADLLYALSDPRIKEESCGSYWN